jgi:hypothetical protein
MEASTLLMEGERETMVMEIGATTKYGGRGGAYEYCDITYCYVEVAENCMNFA